LSTKMENSPLSEERRTRQRRAGVGLAKNYSEGKGRATVMSSSKGGTTRNQTLDNAYIWLQYGCFGCIWNQLHRSLVVGRWLQLERCNSLRQPWDVALQQILLMQWTKNPIATNSWLLEKILQRKKSLMQPILGCNNKYYNEQKRKCNQFLVAILNIATITLVA
jgi:hypothetical protein